MKNFNLMPFIEDGTQTPQRYIEKGKRKVYTLTVSQIKICSLNYNAREIVFTNDDNLKPNRFEDMCERALRHLRDKGYKYKIYDWKPDRITFLVSPEHLKNTVRDKFTVTPQQFSNKIIREMELSESLPIDKL